MQSTTLIKLFLEKGKAKPKSGFLFGKQKPKNNLNDIGELLLNPLKVNLKKDVLTRAEKLAPQISLGDAVYKVATFFSKNNLNVQHLFEFNENLYGPLNKQDHSERVLFYAVYIAISEKLNANDVLILADAAKLHDIGRNTYETDLLHGQKSANLIRYYNLINYQNQDDYAALLSVIDAHSAYDKNIEGVLNKYEVSLSNYEKVKKMCSILKDAEALDKIRFFQDSAINTERMLKSNLLKTYTAKQMVSLAFELNEFYITKK